MYLSAEPRASRVPQQRKRTGTKRAKTLPYDQVEQLIRRVSTSSNSPHSDALKLALSFYGGLRVGEIAQLTVSDLLDPTGRTSPTIHVRGSIAKNGRDRVVPMHPRVAELFEALRTAHPEVTRIAFSSRYGTPRPQTVEATTKWFTRVFANAGLKGCSSHSGRRTFITGLARAANAHGSSLADVQRIAGHAHLETTQLYIEPSDQVGALIASLGAIPAPRPTHQPQSCA